MKGGDRRLYEQIVHTLCSSSDRTFHDPVLVPEMYISGTTPVSEEEDKGDSDST